MNIVVHTNLTMDEVKQRLESATATRWWQFSMVDFVPLLVFAVGDKRPPVFGKFSGSSIRLEKRRHYRNGSAPVFYGKLEPESSTGGTRLTGRFGMSTYTKVGTGCTLAFWCFLAAGFWVAGGPDASKVLLIMLAMLAGGIATHMLGRLISRSEESFLIEFIERTLEATSVQRDQ